MAYGIMGRLSLLVPFRHEISIMNYIEHKHNWAKSLGRVNAKDACDCSPGSPDHSQHSFRWKQHYNFSCVFVRLCCVFCRASKLLTFGELLTLVAYWESTTLFDATSIMAQAVTFITLLAVGCTLLNGKIGDLIVEDYLLVVVAN